MKLSRFTKGGIAAFTDCLDNIHKNDQSARIETICKDSSLTEKISDIECISIDKFPILKLEAAEYVYKLIQTVNVSSPEKDVGMWSWLSALYFKKICIKNKFGEYSPGKLYRWIPDPNNYQTYYRHLIAGPWRIYKLYKQELGSAISLLLGDVTVQGDFYEQIASRQEFVTNRSFIELATFLYYDSINNRLKKGAAGKGDGSSRRLATVANQFSRTWDLYSMDREAFSGLLPKEFNRFMV